MLVWSQLHKLLGALLGLAGSVLELGGYSFSLIILIVGSVRLSTVIMTPLQVWTNRTISRTGAAVYTERFVVPMLGIGLGAAIGAAFNWWQSQQQHSSWKPGAVLLGVVVVAAMSQARTLSTSSKTTFETAYQVTVSSATSKTWRDFQSALHQDRIFTRAFYRQGRKLLILFFALDAGLLVLDGEFSFIAHLANLEPSHIIVLTNPSGQARIVAVVWLCGMAYLIIELAFLARLNVWVSYRELTRLEKSVAKYRHKLRQPIKLATTSSLSAKRLSRRRSDRSRPGHHKKPIVRRALRKIFH